MKSSVTAPDAVLLLTPVCPHCPAVLEAMAQLVKRGVIGRLEVINLAQHPAAGERFGGVRSVPWIRIGKLDFHGSHSLAELEHWAGIANHDQGISEYLIVHLKDGQISLIESKLRAHPDWFRLLLAIIPDMDAPMQARIGVGALFETFAGEPLLEATIAPLTLLSRHADHRVRGDACYYLGLSRSPAARAALMQCLQDDSAEVREIARESLAGIPTPH